jgi:anti-sigma factor RsiW
MSDCATDRLSAYLDDELSATEREAVEHHLRQCAECEQTLADLRRVVARAAALTGAPPAKDLWPGIARATSGASRAVRVSLTIPELAAAAVLLMALSGGAVWLVQRAEPPVPDLARLERATPAVEPVRFAGEQYDLAIADLERALDEGRSRLDPQTVRVLEASLEAIDRAIEQSRLALAADPADPYLTNHLAEAKKRKLALLRRASALVPPEG